MPSRSSSCASSGDSAKPLGQQQQLGSQGLVVDVCEAWAGADLMIKGLELAGPNPTRSAVIKDLRAIKAYDANGLLAQPINYSTIFGHDLPKQCAWVMEAHGNGFTPVSSQPVCGTDVPGTSLATSS